MIRIGEGIDVHKLVSGRKLILLGVEVPYELGLLGHSDADVAAHALCDCLLGAVGLGDIGVHFPDTCDTYKDIDSMLLLDDVVKKTEALGYHVVNVDVTIIAQKPKLAGFIEQMRENAAVHLKISPEFVNVKATTTEKLGFNGRGEGITASAVCLVEKKTD